MSSGNITRSEAGWPAVRRFLEAIQLKGYLEQRIGAAPLLTALRYAGALACVAAGMIFGAWLHPLLDAAVFLLAAVVIAAWFSGFWPAMLGAVVASLGYDYLFVPPIGELTLNRAHVPRILLFAAIAFMFATASAGRRRAERSLAQNRDELDEKVRERTRELEELAGRLIDAQEQERSRIGRELHDHISQMLGVLAIRIDQLRADGETPAAIAATLQDLRGSAADISTEVHRLSHRLHSSALDYLGLVPALQRLVGEFSAHGIQIEFTHAGVLAPLPPGVALCLFRVSEEGLTNIVKHSHAGSARLELIGTPDGIRLSIRDDGKGFDPGSVERGSAGLGFVSMRERLRALRGTVRVDTAPGRGTAIEAWIPAAH